DHRFLGGAADPDPEHAGWTPSGAHGGHRFQHPVDYGVRGLQHRELGFIFRAATLGGYLHIDGITRDDLVVDDRGGVVLGVLAGAFRRIHDRGAQHVIRVQVGSAHTLVDHVGDTHGRRARLARPANVHADFHEHRHDAGVLADRPPAFGTHAAVG